MNLSRRGFLRVGGTAAALTAVSGCGKMPGLGYSGRAGLASGPFAVPLREELDEVVHVMNRLSFGVPPGEYSRVRGLAEDPAEAVRLYIEEQLHPERIGDGGAERVVRRFEALNEPMGELFEYKEDVLLEQMVLDAVLRATLSKRQLYEIMVQFWTDHFNIDPSKGDCRWLKAWDDREVVRRHALGDGGRRERGVVVQTIRSVFESPGQGRSTESGKFPDLLRASALSPAMLWYLDGKENRKAGAEDRPNENYARELLELHTLGVYGGYTQRDVMEVARCLTGWTVRGRNRFSKGKVEFEPSLHDDGPKLVLGQTIPSGLGAGDLDRVLGIVGLHPATATHLATKLCRWFISDEPPKGAVEVVARAFLGSGGDIRVTLRTLFGTEEFLVSRGMKFKRPFHFVVSVLRATGARVKPDRHVVEFLERMGHVPFHYPTPDGYPAEASPWIGTLLWRWNCAVALEENRLGGVQVDLGRLIEEAGGEENLMAHVLGRRPMASEAQAYHRAGSGLALLFGSPAFQKY